MTMIARRNPLFLLALVLIILLVLSGCSNDQADKNKQAKIHMTSANSYLNQGQYRAAIIEARNVIKYSPNTPKGYIVLASVYNELGNGTSTVKILKPMLTRFPQEVGFTLAKGYALSGKFRSALKHLGDNNNLSIKGKILRAQCLSGLQEYERANTIYSQILSQDKTNIEAQLGIINTLLITGKTKQAVLAIDKVLVQSPSNPEALLLKAQMAYQINNLDSSEKYLTEALQYLPQTDIITPQKSRILEQLADTLTQLGRPSEGLIYTRILAEANPDAHQAKQKFIKALKLYQAGDLDKAEMLLLNLYKEHPSNAISGMLLGIINLQKGDLVKAGELLIDNVDAETTSSRIINSTAITQLQLNQPKKAVALLEEAIKSHPNNASTHAIYGLAILKINPTDTNGSLALHKALAIDPDRYKLHIVLARHYLALNRPEQAYAQFNMGLKKKPADNELQKGYIQALLRYSEHDRATRVAQEYITKYPTNPKVYLQAAQISLQTQNFSKAEEQLKKSISLDNQNITALLDLGQIQLINKQWGESSASFRKVLAIEPNPFAYKGLITIQEAQHKGEQIITKLTETASDEPDNSVLLAVLAEYYARKNISEKSLEYADKSIAVDNATSYARNIASSIYRIASKQLLANADIPAARSKLSTALKLTPNKPTLINDLVILEVTIKNFTEATKLADQIDLSQPEKSIGKYLKGFIHTSQEQWPEAIQDLQAAWEIRKNDTIGLLYYETLLKSDRPLQAASLLDDWITNGPKSGKPLVIKGISLQKNNSNDLAINFYKQALSLNPKNILAANNLAWLYFTIGNNEALVLAKQALELAPNNADVLDTAGWIFVNSGSKAEGIQALEKAYQLSKGKNDEINNHLEKARKM